MRSSKTMRSPVGTPRPSVNTHGNVKEINLQTPEDKIRERHDGQKRVSPTQSSPRLEFILKMRRSEEEALQKCQKVLRKIRHAMSKQKNINMDVQNGITELEELVDVIGDYRRNWTTAERDRKESIIVLEETKTAHRSQEAETPSTMQSKRSASSPAEINPSKKPKEIQSKENVEENLEKHASKQKVSKENFAKTSRGRTNSAKGKNWQTKPKERSEAVMIKPQQGHSYADVLKDLRSKVKPEDNNVAVRSIRKTKTGAILLVMGKGGNKGEFCNAVKDTLKEAAVVEDLSPKATIEIQDLDALSSVEEVIAAINRVTKLEKDEMKVHLTAANIREQKRAFVTLPVTGAKELLKTERLKIAMTNCRIRYREETKRCYRCFGTGHLQWECKGPDRKGMGLCIQCGESGHKIKECKNTPKCCICFKEGKTPTNHLPGSKRCKPSQQNSK